jgi:uncharacterized membrane protein
MKSSSLWSLLIVLFAMVAGIFAFAVADSQIRSVVVLGFLVICPGMMLVRFIRLREPVFEWVLALALSLAVDAIVAGILLYAGRWSPTSAFVILLSLTVVGALANETIGILSRRRTVQ